MSPRPRSKRGLTPIFSNILLILIIVLGMSVTFAFLTGYVTDFQLGQGSAVMELLEFEDVWFQQTDLINVTLYDLINVTLYNYGKVDVTVLAVYLDGLQANFTNRDSDDFLILAMGGHDSIQISPPHYLDKTTPCKLRIVTERGSAFDGQFTTP
jgi:FlaG/FlaF family flagellin (archaellin)